jgi:hypothetical protein
MKLSADELYDILLIFREHLIPCWERYHAEGPNNFRRSDCEIPEILAKGACRHTSAFLYKQLKAVGLEDLKPCGGLMRHAEPLDGDALIDFAGAVNTVIDDEGYAWEPHYWLEHNGMIIDITKDQFGWSFDDIHDLETAGMIYREDASYQASKRFAALKATVSKFEGVPQTYWQDGDPHFAKVAESFADSMERARVVLGQTAAAGMRA